MTPISLARFIIVRFIGLIWRYPIYKRQRDSISAVSLRDHNPNRIPIFQSTHCCDKFIILFFTGNAILFSRNSIFTS